MTTFSYPLNVKRPYLATGADHFTAGVLMAADAGVSVGNTGTAASTTTIPLFVAPAGSTFVNSFLDIRAAYDNTAGVNITVGTAANPAAIWAATTVNTTGRRTYTPSAAQLILNTTPLTADTTVQAIVSITTSAVTAGDVLVAVYVL